MLVHGMGVYQRAVAFFLLPFHQRVLYLPFFNENFTIFAETATFPKNDEKSRKSVCSTFFFGLILMQMQISTLAQTRIKHSTQNRSHAEWLNGLSCHLHIFCTVGGIFFSPPFVVVVVVVQKCSCRNFCAALELQTHFHLYK